MTENYLYFGEGGGANATTEAGCFACSKLTGISPIIKTTTGIYFEGTTNAQDAGELVTLTHSSNISGEGRSSGHQVRDIANAVATACNATPKGQFITIADMDQVIGTSRLQRVNNSGLVIRGEYESCITFVTFNNSLQCVLCIGSHSIYFI